MVATHALGVPPGHRADPKWQSHEPRGALQVVSKVCELGASAGGVACKWVCQGICKELASQPNTPRDSSKTVSWGRLGAVLGPSWGCLGAVLVRLGAVVGGLGAVWGRLGAFLGSLGAVLGGSWGRLGPCWGSWGEVLGRLGAV